MFRFYFHLLVVLVNAFAVLPIHGTHDPIAIRYDAAIGNGNPEDQGWAEEEVTAIGADNDADGVLDGNANVGLVSGPSWQILDRRAEASLNAPGYRRALISTELAALFENGWTFTARVRAVGISHATSSFVGWQFRKGSDPGYGIGASAARVGFHFFENAVGEFVINPTFRPTVNLGPGSGDGVHTLRAVALPRSPVFEWFLNDVSQGFLDIRDFPYGSDESILIGSNSPAGIGDGADWFEVSLESGPRLDITSEVEAIQREILAHDDSIVGNGVDTATGSFQQAYNLLTVRGVRPVEFPIYYDSRLTERPGPMGYGWSHAYEARLQVDSPDAVTIHWDANRRSEFSFVEAIGAQRFFDGAEEDSQYAELVENAIGSNLLFPNGSWRLTLLDGTVYAFDPMDGRLVYVANSAQQGFDLSYDTAGRLVSVQEKFTDAQIELDYNDRGLVSSVRDPLGRQVLLDYDSDWMLESVPSPVMDAGDDPERETRFVYASRLLTAATDVLDAPLFSCTYDIQGRILSQDDGHADTGSSLFVYTDAGDGRMTTRVVDALGHAYQFTHDAKFHLLRVVDPLGHEVSYTYDALGNRTSATNARGFTTRFDYNPNGGILSMEDPAGFETTFDYDVGSGVNFVSSITDAFVESDGSRRTTSIQYMEKRMIAVIDAMGNADRKTYERDTGQVRGISLADSADVQFDLQGGAGRIIGASHPNDATTKRSADYDAAGRQTERWTRSGHKTEIAYNTSSDVISETDPDGNTTTTEYDHRGRRTRVTDKRGHATTYTYDGNGNLLTVTDALGGVTSYTYDALDRRVEETNPLGQTTRFHYDAIGQRIAVTDSLGRTTRTEYDPNGNVSAQFDRQGVRIVAFTYDNRDLMTTAVDAYGHETTIAYDAVGRRTSSTDSKGRTVFYHYDKLDRPTGATDPLGRRSLITYEQDDVVDTLQAPGTTTVNFDYTKANLLRQHFLANGDRFDYEYDSDDRLVSFDTGVRRQEFAYDSLGRLLRDEIDDALGNQQNRDRRYAYDPNGNLTAVESKHVSEGDANFMVRHERTYDALNRLTSYTDETGNTLGFGYDALGNLTSIVYPDGWTVHYAYDEANRLMTVTDGDSRITRYTYDRRDLVSRIELPNGTERRLKYDSGNRLLHREDVDVVGRLIVGYHYSYDQEGQLVTELASPEPPPVLPNAHTMSYNNVNQLTMLDGEALSYDREGNLINGPSTYGLGQLSYDARGRLVSTDNYDYDYDEEDRLIAWQHRESGAKTSFVLSPNAAMSQILAKTDPDGTLTRFVYGIGLLYEETGGSTLTHHYDSRGSSVAFSNASGASVGRVAYGAYGQVTHQEGETSSIFLFNALYGVLSAPEGLNHMRFRWYWPDVGRFITADAHFGSALHIATMNRYGYAGGNPISNIDPHGEFFFAAIGAAIGAVVGAGAELISAAANREAVDWGRVGAAAAGGAVAGAITGGTAGLGFIAGGAVATGAGAVGGYTEAVLGGAFSGQVASVDEVLAGVGSGALGGALGFVGGKALGKLAGGKASSKVLKKATAQSKAIKRRGIRGFDDLIKVENQVRRLDVIIRQSKASLVRSAAIREFVADITADVGASTAIASLNRPDPAPNSARGSAGVNPHGAIAIYRQGASEINAGRLRAYGEHRHYRLFIKALSLAGHPVPNNPSNTLTGF